MKKQVDFMEIDWVCPYCGSKHIEDYKRTKRYGYKYEEINVICDDCKRYYLIFSDLTPQEDGSLMGVEDEDANRYNEEDKKSAYEDQLYHEARDEGVI